MSVWRIFSQFSGRCVTSQLTLILCPLLLHPHLSYHPLQVHVIVIAINHYHPYPHDDILLYERCCREKCVERSLGNVTLINFVAGRGGEQAAICVSILLSLLLSLLISLLLSFLFLLLLSLSINSIHFFFCLNIHFNFHFYFHWVM